MTTEPTAHKLVVFLDTNILLEGKPPPELPWHEIDAEGPILALVTPTALDEIDAHKRDGRVGERARAFNRLIAAAATRGEVVAVRATSPKVDLSIATCPRIDWSKHEELDPSKADARIVAEVLAAAEGTADTKRLVSQDIAPLSMARRAGITTIHASTDWLLPKEPSPSDKELMRLRQKVKEVTATEPRLLVSVNGPTSPMRIFQVPPISAADGLSLTDAFIRANPRPSRSWMPHTMDDDGTLDERYDRFCNETVPAFVAQLHRKLSQTYAQVPFSVRIENVGSIRADKLIVQIRGSAGTLHDKYAIVPLDGPRCPDKRSIYARHMVKPSDIVPRVGRHEHYLAVAPAIGAQLIEMHCEDFRHGHHWLFAGVASLDADNPAPMVIDVRLTAANLHGEVTGQLSIPKMIVRRTIDELADLSEGVFVTMLPIQEAIERAIATHNFSQFEKTDQLEPDEP